MLRHLKFGQEDKKTDFRAEQPPHYDLVNIPVDPMTEKKRKKKVKYALTGLAQGIERPTAD